MKDGKKGPYLEPGQSGGEKKTKRNIGEQELPREENKKKGIQEG